MSEVRDSMALKPHGDFWRTASVLGTWEDLGLKSSRGGAFLLCVSSGRQSLCLSVRRSICRRFCPLVLRGHRGLLLHPTSQRDCPRAGPVIQIRDQRSQGRSFLRVGLAISHRSPGTGR